MPRKIRPKLCGCGCGETTRGGQFLPGHDSKTLSAIVESVGGTLELKRIVEDALNRRIYVNDPIPPIAKNTTVVEIILTKETAEQLAITLIKSGYAKEIKQAYNRYTKKYGDSVFVSHSLNIVRCTPNTKASVIIENILGSPNGVASIDHDDNFDSWFLNGYEGRAGTALN